MTARCDTCRWWREKGAKVARIEKHPNPEEGVGTCELYPPTVVLVGPGWTEAVYPETRAERGCGEWKPADEDGGGGGEEQPGSADGKPQNIVPFGRAA